MMRWRREEGGKEEGAVCSDGARSVVDGLGGSPTERCLCAHAHVVKLEEAWIGMLAYTRTSNRNAAGPSVTCE